MDFPIWWWLSYTDTGKLWNKRKESLVCRRKVEVNKTNKERNKKIFVLCVNWFRSGFVPIWLIRRLTYKQITALLLPLGMLFGAPSDVRSEKLDRANLTMCSVAPYFLGSDLRKSEIRNKQCWKLKLLLKLLHSDFKQQD